jgi:LysM repeat protein
LEENPLITGGGFSFNLFKREPTPTSTMPPTPVLSPTPSMIPTETPTPTLTVSPTPSGPFEYEVMEFDSCWGIAEKFEVDLQTLLAINNFEGGTCPIYPGQKIKVPAPGQTLPTPTPIPPDMAKGTRIDYTVQAGDSIRSIADQFYSTVEDILAINKDKIDDENNIAVGMILVIRVNLVTPVPTFAPTSTLAS